MKYEVRIIDAFTGHILHPDGSGRTQRDGDTGFHEIFESRESAFQRKDELLLRPNITEVLVVSEDRSEATAFRNQELIERIIAERKTRKAPNQRPRAAVAHLERSAEER